MKESREYYKQLKPESLMMSYGYKWDLEQALAHVETPGTTTISRAESEPLTV